MRKGNTVDEYILADERWQAELLLLREIIQDSELEETIKWGGPVYTINNKNVLGMAAFKNYVGMWFFQGVFLEDKFNKLLNAQEGKTNAMRQWRFSNLEDIEQDAKFIKIYIEEAIENQKQGKELKPSRKKEVLIPVELKEALEINHVLKERFESLSKYKQREYAQHVGSAKQEATRLRRLKKVIPMIEAGIGFNDKYRNC
ncbi:MULTISPECIES: YdeI family protein [unclassified Lentimicrobium]|uniref:YdeI/OmpD-associated family protein n=1 Tax=unclassified Lentimicrobium TaxID=2677434 RepID=UPI0015519387|nr:MULTISPECIES: DUF1801 domain-containing protein [unclassified Lentimicrobium]NPD47343.1 hypothetical protein [Lentimicrobium sp. S6]NPD85331.1 hypothetical protein [Lentimicrobium sp. L6]